MNRGDDRYSDEESSYEYDNCCLYVSQSFVFWCNVLLLIVGLVGMGLSIYIWCIDTMDWAGGDIALRFTIFSAFLMLIAMLGIQGTWNEMGKCDLVVYLLLLFVIVIAQIGVVIYISLNESDFKDYLEGIWEDWSDARKLQAMESYECGVYQPNPPDVPGYGNVTINDDTHAVANCLDPSGTDITDYCYDDCWKELEESITTFGTLTTVCLIIFAVFELSLLVCSSILVCSTHCDGDDYYSDEESDPRFRGRVV